MDSTINKDAECFTYLDTLFSAKKELSFSYTANTEKVLRVSGVVVNEKIEHFFTMALLGDVCPSLKRMLVYMLESSQESKHLQKGIAVRTLWSHCKNPGYILSIGALDDEHTKKETYLREIIALQSLDVPDNTVSVMAWRYMFIVLQEKNSLGLDSPTIETVIETDSLFPINYKLNLAAVDKIYPGFSVRAQAAIALNLPEKEAADFATGKNGLAVDHEVSHGFLPNLS